jgi:hypothetical protein
MRTNELQAAQVISIKLTFRPLQFHWMIGAIMGVGSGKSFSSVGILSADCPYERAAGGSTILVRNNVLHSYVNLNTDLQAVAVRITLDKTITLCSVYIQPNSALERGLLSRLQLVRPHLHKGCTRNNF